MSLQKETEDEPPALLETLLQESPNSVCLQSVDGFSKKSKPIHSVRFTCNDEILQLAGSDTIALYRLRDVFQARTMGMHKDSDGSSFVYALDTCGFLFEYVTHIPEKAIARELYQR